MRYAAALLACLAFPATADTVKLTAAQVGQIKATIAYDLLDAESARFRNIRAVEITKRSGATFIRVCGEVNAKNAMGGYAGFDPFGGVLKDGRFREQDFYGACE